MLLQNLEISNFKAFKSVQLNDLGRVNLLVGKNNCGKTSVLEALRVFAGNGSLQSFLELAAEREDTGPLGFLEEDEELKALVLGLFKDYDLQHNNPIVIGDAPQHKTITIEYATYVMYGEAAQDRTRKKNPTPQELDEINYDALNVEFFDGLEIVDFYKNKKIINFNSSIRSNLIQNRSRTEKNNYPLFYVSSKSNDIRDMPSLWDTISLDDGKKRHIIDAINLIDCNIKNLAFIDSKVVSDIIRRSSMPTLNKGVYSRVPFVRLKNSDFNIPLKSMGDGVHRILDIVLHLISAEKGILLIDEFENGLHYAVQEKLWGLIFKIATELSVQVFVTTHSADCVHSFARASMETDEDGVLYRIARPQQADEPHFVRRYSEEGLSDALDAEVEVR